MSPLDVQHDVYCFVRNRLAPKLNKEEGPNQVSGLIYSMATDAEKSFSHFTLTEEQQNNFERVLQEFGKYFVPKKNVIHERTTFHRRTQREGKSIEEYIRSVYELSEHAKFADRLVLGMLDQRRRLLH